MAESDLSDHFLQIGDSSNGESVSFNTFFIFNQALPDSEIASICSIMAQSFPVHTPTIEPEPEVIEKTIFDFLNNPDSVSDGATVKIIPDGSGQMFYRQVSFGSKVITVDFSNYEKVTINCSGFTKISDKIYSVTGTFYPWITGNSETKTSISIMED